MYKVLIVQFLRAVPCGATHKVGKVLLNVDCSVVSHYHQYSFEQSVQPECWLRHYVSPPQHYLSLRVFALIRTLGTQRHGTSTLKSLKHHLILGFDPNGSYKS